MQGKRNKLGARFARGAYFLSPQLPTRFMYNLLRNRLKTDLGVSLGNPGYSDPSDDRELFQSPTRGSTMSRNLAWQSVSAGFGYIMNAAGSTQLRADSGAGVLLPRWADGEKIISRLLTLRAPGGEKKEIGNPLLASLLMVRALR